MTEILTLAYNVALYILATFGSALLIIVTGILLGRILGKIASRSIKKANLNGNLRKTLGIKTKPQKIAENFVKYSIIGVATIAALIPIELPTNNLENGISAIINMINGIARNKFTMVPNDLFI